MGTPPGMDPCPAVIPSAYGAQGAARPRRGPSPPDVHATAAGSFANLLRPTPADPGQLRGGSSCPFVLCLSVPISIN